MSLTICKTPESRKNLEKKMYDIANKIIGNVGSEIDKTFINTRWGEIAFFCLHREINKSSDIMDVWIKWIKAYCFFKKLHTPEMAIINDNPELVVRWFKVPEVHAEGHSDEYIKANSNDEHWQCWKGGKPDIKNPSFVRVRAYLSIERVDYNPIRVDSNIGPRILSHKS